MEEGGEHREDGDFVRVLGRREVVARALGGVVCDEVHARREASDARPSLGRRMVEEVGVDRGDQPRDRRAHPPLRAQPHIGHAIVEGALEERHVETIVERELVARGARPELLVVADEEELLRRCINRREHVRLEHLSGLLHDKHLAPELPHERLVLGRAGGGEAHDGRLAQLLERLLLVEVDHRRREPPVVGDGHIELAHAL